MCQDGNGGLVRFPIFPELSAAEIPWDLSLVIDERRYKDYIDHMLAWHTKAAKPSLRTLASKQGFDMWIEYAKAEELAMDEGRSTYLDAMYVSPGKDAVFDHRVFREQGSLALFDREELRYYGRADLRDAALKLYKPPTAQEKKVETRDLKVFGA